MPIYEYRCAACGHYMDALQKMSDAPLKTCPECGKGALVRLISAPVFRLKGGGWYETDFKSDKEKKRNLAGGEDKPSTDGEGTAARRKAPKKAAREATKPNATKVAAKPRKKKSAKTPSKAAAKAKAKSPAKAKAKAKPQRGVARSPAKAKSAPKKVPARKTRR